MKVIMDGATPISPPKMYFHFALDVHSIRIVVSSWISSECMSEACCLSDTDFTPAAAIMTLTI